METKVEEIWKDVIGYECLYEISSLGRVRSNKFSPKILKPLRTGMGYLFVALSKNKVVVRYYIHRLVAENFINNHFFQEIVNHKDGNPLNNRVENLEWCNQSHNIRDAIKRRGGYWHHSNKSVRT